MRIVFFLFLLANLAFFAWTYLGSGRALDESQLVAQQVNPQEIRLLSGEQVGKLAAERAKEVSERPKAPSKPPVAACLELGGFSPGDVPQVQKALEPLGLGARLTQRRAEEVASYWVFIPPLRSRQSANLKAAELKKLGVDDFFVVQEDSKLRFSVSLGVFKTEDAANSRLAELQKKGVRTARVGPRETSVQKVYFSIREVPDALAAKLNDLRQNFAGTELKECASEEKRAGK